MRYFIIIILLSNLIISYLFFFKNKLSNKEILLLNKEMEGLTYTNLLLQSDIINMIQGRLSLSDQIFLFSEKEEKIKLKDLNRKNYTLVLRYSYLSCMPCVDFAVTSLKEFMKQNNDIGVLLLSTYSQKKDLRDFKRINKFSSEVYHVDSVNLSIDKDNIPYFFILDKDLKAFNIFFST